MVRNEVLRGWRIVREKSVTETKNGDGIKMVRLLGMVKEVVM